MRRCNDKTPEKYKKCSFSEENHACFELTSKIIDFLLIEGDSQPDTLIILSEEEIVFLDLGK